MPPPRPHLHGSCFVLRLAEERDVQAIVAHVLRNREHHGPFEPVRPPEHFTEPGWRARVQAAEAEHAAGRGCAMFLFSAEGGTVLGHVNLSNIVRGAFQACHLGYGIDRSHEGRGLMSEAVELAVRFAFDELGLHRVMANHLPHNVRSERLLARLGFVVEGHAREYLLIDGRWQDHVLTALVNPRWAPRD